MTGLTPEQRSLLERGYCDQGHRFDGANYPTPEGVCPLCTWSEVRDQINQYQMLLVEQSSQPRAPLHQAIGLVDQSAAPSLTASTER